jgi:periplasmic protein TonB
MIPALPTLRHRRPAKTLGWVASAFAVALALSGLAAVAMAIAPPGESQGDAAPVPILSLPPSLTLEALSDPVPAIPQEAPYQTPAPQMAEGLPELPETQAPPVALPDPVAASTVPEMEQAPVAGLLPPPPPTKTMPQPRKTAKAPPEKPKAEPTPRKPDPAPEKPARKPKAEQKPAAASTAAAPSKAATSAASAGAGKKAVASYGAAIMRKIHRTAKRRSPARGVAVVGFSVSASGELASVRIMKSSGSAALDEVALDHIRRSAPFPAPPQGAGRKYSFEFVGK